MKEGQRRWTREELTLAINLYSKMLFGQMHKGNPAIIELAGLIGRTPDAVAYKLVNFASLDPKLQQRGIKGMDKVSKLDRVVWQEYTNNWDLEFFEGEKLLAQKKNSTIIQENEVDLSDLPPIEGKEREALVRVRVNQTIFRRLVLTNFNYQCCITGITIPELLVASHIIPWSKDENNRVSPKNGLSLNALHDKAFDRYLITVTEDLKIKVSSRFNEHRDIETVKQNFLDYDDKQIILPKKFDLSADFLKYHNDQFKG